jgi:hypothetical protein
MTKFYSLEDVRGDEFYQLPKDLVKNKKYSDLSASAKIAYAVLKDRHQVSLKNHWVDDVGVYFLLSDSELAEILDTSVRSASRYKNDLQSFGLIHMERQGLNKRNKIYLLKPDTDILEQNTPEPLVLADRTILSSPDKTKLSSQDRTKLSSQDRTKLSTYSNNNLSNNDLSNNKKEEEEEKITIVGVTTFANEQIQKREITNKKTLFAIYEQLSKCKSIGTSNVESMQNYVVKVIEEKMSKLGQKQKESKQSSKKPIRTELIPKWMNKDESKEELIIKEETTKKKTELEERLKKYKK